MTLRQALAQAPPGVLRRDAETLALHVLARDRAWLHAHPEAELTASQAAAIHTLLARRAAGEPLQYLIGHQEFFGLDLRVSPAVLIPRPETEHLVEAVLDWAANQAPQKTLRLLDVGTGSGAIALALATHLPDAEITALDVSPAALAIAGENATRLGLMNSLKGTNTRLRFLESDLLGALGSELGAGERFDVIVSNPPYIPSGDAGTLATEVRDHEPALALFAGKDGLDLYRRLVPEAAAALRAGGLLAMEFGFGQRDQLDALFARQPAGTWGSWRFSSDLQGIPRVVEAIRA